MKYWLKRKLTPADGERMLWNALEHLEEWFGVFGERGTVGEMAAILVIRKILGVS